MTTQPNNAAGAEQYTPTEADLLEMRRTFAQWELEETTEKLNKLNGEENGYNA